MLLLQVFTKRIKKGVWDLRAIIDSGGMPSSHSALCTVLQRCAMLKMSISGHTQSAQSLLTNAGRDNSSGAGVWSGQLPFRCCPLLHADHHV